MEASEEISVDTKNTPAPAGGQGAPDLTAAPASPPARVRKHRTVGNKVFDLLVYPTIAFGAVFAISVWTGYLSRFTDGRIHQWYKKLSQGIETLPTVRHLPEGLRAKKAWSHALVAVSFATGTFLMVPVKLFEDGRDKLSKLFDRMLGTTPQNPDEYRKEPRQSWASVMGGRLLTFAVVFGVATLFGERIEGTSSNLATRFTKPKIPPLANKELQKSASTKWQLWFVSSFETFYTALCAALVYVISRTMAKIFNKREEEKNSRVEASNRQLTSLPLAAQTPSVSPTEKSDSKWTGRTETKPRPEPSVNYGAGVDASRSPVGAAVS